jgi:hypothetical protein
VISRVFKSTTILPYLIQLNLIMPRRPLAQINNNSIQRKELSPYVRGIITGKHHSGFKTSHISQQLQIPRSTVNDTIQQISRQNNSKSIP